MVEFIYFSSFLMNFTSTLDSKKNDISSTTSILILANKKVFF